MRTTAVAICLCAATAATAVEAPAAMHSYIESDLSVWVNDPSIVAAIKQQNKQTADLTEAEIIARDTRWRAEVGQSDSPTIDAVLNTPVSEFLVHRVHASGGLITEVFVMDHKGLNVAASAVTSDYWQGDEAKFLETYPKGAGAVFVDDVAYDESTQAYQGQVSFSIVDPDSGDVIGAITVGLNADGFF